MIALRVNSKSSHVIGVPSAHFAAGLILNLTVKGFWVRSPLASVGASVSSGDLSNVPWSVSCIARGITYCVADQ